MASTRFAQLVQEIDKVKEPIPKLRVIRTKNVISDNRYMIEISKLGIAYKDFEVWARDYPISNQEWASLLHMPFRTYNRYKAENRIFVDHDAEHILKLFSFITLGEEFFDDKESFFGWIKLSSYALGDKTPYSFMDSTYGLEYLIDYLGQMEHGIFS